MADLLDGWPKELQELAELAVVARVEEKEGGGQAVSVEQLVHSEGPLALSLSDEAEKVPIGVVHGLCALLWARPKEAPLQLDLSEREVGAEGLLALARAMTPTLASLNLEGSNCANNGGDLSGVRQLCTALRTGAADGLRELKCVATPSLTNSPLMPIDTRRFARWQSWIQQHRRRGRQGAGRCAPADADYVARVRCRLHCPAVVNAH